MVSKLLCNIEKSDSDDVSASLAMNLTTHH